MDSPEQFAEVDRLLVEMDRVDDALAVHLDNANNANCGGKRTRDLRPPLEFARLQIKAWCVTAGKRGRYDAEVLRVTMMAIDAMNRRELAEMLGRLLKRAEEMTTRPAA